MKLVTYQSGTEARAGFLRDQHLFDLQTAGKELNIELPSTIEALLLLEEEGMQQAQKVAAASTTGKVEGAYDLLAPVTRPTSCRDAYAFRQHVATARRNRGVPMIPEFDQFPIFYFTNHNAVYGEGDLMLEADHFEKLDFELEVAVVIGKRGKNIPSSKADAYIAGFTIMNDLSARRLQMEEMKLNLGPAKGKDFATTIGPWLVTPDELADYLIKTPFGNSYDLRMEAFHNGEKISDGNMKDMTWTFAEIIERCSYGTEIYPGDVIGSGTVGTGCYLELNGTRTIQAQEKGQEYDPIWLQPEDSMELRITGLGSLTNRMVRRAHDWSLLDKKKMD